MKKKLVSIILGFTLISSMAIASFAQEDLLKDKNFENFNINISGSLQPDKVVSVHDMLNQMKLGSKSYIRVYDNPSTGYSWNVKIEGQDGVIQVKSDMEKPKIEDVKTKDNKVQVQKPMICGEGAYRIFEIDAKKVGKVKLTLSQSRSFEKDKPAIETMEYYIDVK